MLPRPSYAALLLGLAISAAAFGQTPLVPPANVPYGTPVSPDAAKKIAAAAIAEARKNKWAMAVAVVDTGGYLVYFERMPDTQLGSVEIAWKRRSQPRCSAARRNPSRTRWPPAGTVSACFASLARS